MKPPPQISPDQRNSRCDNRTPDDSRNFPSTDYNFQSTTEACGSVSTISQEKLRTFWKLSGEFFSAENRRHHATELLLFALISGISAWPIISALVGVVGFGNVPVDVEHERVIRVCVVRLNFGQNRIEQVGVMDSGIENF